MHKMARLAVAFRRILSFSARKFSKQTEHEDSFYLQFSEWKSRTMKTLSENRFQSIHERKDFSVVSEDFFKASLRGRYLVEHRGHSLMKEPRDITIYQRLLWDVKPANIIEMGTYAGGSALWMSDMLKMMEIDSTIYTIDNNLSYVSDEIKKSCSPNVHFWWGDAYEIEKIFSNEFIQSLKRPLVVIEDCHVNSLGILEFFHKFMQSGDYFVVEDTCPHIPGLTLRPEVEVLESLDDLETWETNKLDILKKFLVDHTDQYSVDAFFTDMFGYNATWNWHGYIKRMI